MAKEHAAAIVAFIVKGIEAGKKPGAIYSAIFRKFPKIQFTDRTYRKYQTEAAAIVKAAREEREKKDKETEDLLRAAEIASNYCDIDERKQFLAKVVRGEDLRSDPKEKGRPKIPGVYDRLNAVDLLNKMDAVYIKRTKDENPAAPLIIKIGARPDSVKGNNNKPG
jgi:hypothetical protein